MCVLFWVNFPNHPLKIKIFFYKGLFLLPPLISSKRGCHCHHFCFSISSIDVWFQHNFVYTEMGFLDSLFGRDSRKFIKRKDSDAGEAGDFIFTLFNPLLFFFSSIFDFWHLGLCFCFFFLFLSIALWFSNPYSLVWFGGFIVFASSCCCWYLELGVSLYIVISELFCVMNISCIEKYEIPWLFFIDHWPWLFPIDHWCCYLCFFMNRSSHTL